MVGRKQLGSELPQNMWGAMKEGDFNSSMHPNGGKTVWAF